MSRGQAPDARDVAALIAVNVLWGSTYVVGRGVLETAPPLVLALVRFSIASAWMLLLRSHRATDAGTAQEGPPTRRALVALATTGILCFGLAKLLHYEGLARSTATEAALIINLEPVLTAFLAAVVLRQQLGGIQWLGVGVAFAGGTALLWPDQADPAARASLWGNVLMVGAVAAEAASTILGAEASRRYSGLQITAYACYWGTAFLLPFGLWQWSSAGWSVAWATPANIAAILYLALPVTVLTYALWFRVLSRVDAGRAGTFLYAQPVVGVALAVLLRGEWPGSADVVGAALVMAGILLAAHEPRREA